MSRHRNFRFTWNNYPEDVSLSSFPSHSYLIYGKEIAPSTGTPHLQGHITFDSAKTLSAVIKLLPGCHVLVSDFPVSSAVYCEKDKDFVESGVRPKTKKEKGELGSQVYKDAFEAAKNGDFDSIPEGLRFRYYRTIKEIHKDHAVEPAELSGTCGFWFWGLAGAGKSTKARNDFPGAFKKACNKWWDSYQGQEYVIIDDVDHRHECLAHHFKIWADKFGFPAEVKGGMIMIRPKVICITSQYSPEMIWPDFETSTALMRRFSIQEIKKSF